MENPNHHYPELDSMSEQTSRSSAISIIPTIKISERDQLRFDSMICYSDESDDDNLDPIALTNPGTSTNIGNWMNTYEEKQNPAENQEVSKVAILNTVNDNKMTESQPHHSDSTVSTFSASGLSSFLNISGLTEKIPSLDLQQYLFQDWKTKDEQIMSRNDFSEDNDFSFSDGSDFDPKKVDFNSDGSCEEVTEDEYYDDPMVKDSKGLKKNQKGKCNLLHKDEKGKSDKRKKKLQIMKKKIVKSKRNKDFVEENNKENEILIEKRRNEKVQRDEQRMTAEVVSNKREKITEEINIEEKAKRLPGKRTWNRRNACFYCQQVVTNFSRHLLRHHANEIEVLNYQSIKDEDPKIRKQKRQAITDKLRNKGNFIHNSKVSFDRDGESTLLPKKRNNQGTSSPSSYATCKSCLGTFKRTTFFRHLKNCNTSSNEEKLPSLKKRVLYNHSITIIPNTSNASVELRDKILSHLRSDEISLVVKNDPLIVAYGSRLLKKKKERRSRKAICSKMRDLGSLLTIIRKKDSSIETLTDVIDPEKYELFIDSIKTMCGFDEQTGTVKITSIPARMRPSVLGCIDILYTQSIMSTESTAYKESYKKKLDDFKRLIEINWQWEISSNAEKTRKRVNMTKESVIPLDEDIATVMRKIHKLEIKFADKLRKNTDALNYESLCIVTIAHIILLDRKRAGDVAEAELTFYINRKNEEVPEKLLETLTSEQRKSIEDLDVFQIPGKRTRAVPILLTKTMRENIDLIIACREDLNIPNSNRYLFARPSTQEPFDGGKCLEKIKKQCNLKRPQTLTSTGMRHHIATMSQIHAKQNDQYTEHLAGFLGHDLSVHAKNYRLPMQVLQKAVVGTQLIEYENIFTEKKQTMIESTKSDSDFLKDKNIKKSGTSLDQSVQIESITLNADRKNETPKIVIKNSSIVAENDGPETRNYEYQENFYNQTPKTKQTKDIPKIKKTKYTKYSSCSSDSVSDEEKEVQKRNKTKHRKWSYEEIEAVKKYFQTYIIKKKNPGKSKCVEVLNKEPILRNRTWMQLNTYVNNIYKKK